MTTVPGHLQQRLWADLTCGCGARFVADPLTVPFFHLQGQKGHPCCRPCWDRRAVLRKAQGLPEQGRPRCYPDDYLEGT